MGPKWLLCPAPLHNRLLSAQLRCHWKPQTSFCLLSLDLCSCLNGNRVPQNDSWLCLIRDLQTESQQDRCNQNPAAGWVALGLFSWILVWFMKCLISLGEIGTSPFLLVSKVKCHQKQRIPSRQGCPQPVLKSCCSFRKEVWHRLLQNFFREGERTRCSCRSLSSLPR